VRERCAYLGEALPYGRGSDEIGIQPRSRWSKLLREPKWRRCRRTPNLET